MTSVAAVSRPLAARTRRDRSAARNRNMGSFSSRASRAAMSPPSAVRGFTASPAPQSVIRAA
jgi:hypothetical protein